MAINKRALRRPGLTPEEKQAMLTELAQPIIACGVPPTCFVLSAVYLTFLSFKTYLKRVNFVASLHASGVLAGALAIGIKKNFFASLHDCTAITFSKLALYLISAEGQKDIWVLQQQAKLLRQAAGIAKPEDFVLLQAFRAQRQEYTTAVKEICREKLKQLSELEMQQKIKELKSEHLPAALYEEPADEVIGERAWQMYVQNAQARGVAAMERSSGGQQHAEASFRQRARDLAELEFACRPGNREALVAFLEKRLSRFRLQHDARGEKKVRFQLDVLDGMMNAGEVSAQACAPKETLPAAAENTAAPGTLKRPRPAEAEPEMHAMQRCSQ